MKYVKKKIFVNVLNNLKIPIRFMKSSFYLIAAIICLTSIFLSGCVSQPTTPDPIIGSWQYGSVNNNWTNISTGRYSTVSFTSKGEFNEADFGQVVGPNGQPDNYIMGTAPIQAKWVRQQNGTYIVTTQFGGDQLWVYSSSQNLIYNANDKEHVYLRQNSPNLNNNS
jgi:hypothetical protein